MTRLLLVFVLAISFAGFAQQKIVVPIHPASCSIDHNNEYYQSQCLTNYLEYEYKKNMPWDIMAPEIPYGRLFQTILFTVQPDGDITDIEIGTAFPALREISTAIVNRFEIAPRTEDGVAVPYRLTWRLDISEQEYRELAQGMEPILEDSTPPEPEPARSYTGNPPPPPPPVMEEPAPKQKAGEVTDWIDYGDGVRRPVVEGKDLPDPVVEMPSEMNTMEPPVDLALVRYEDLDQVPAPRFCLEGATTNKERTDCSIAYLKRQLKEHTDSRIMKSGSGSVVTIAVMPNGRLQVQMDRYTPVPVLNEVSKVVSQMAVWIPGRKNGVNVMTEIRISI